MGNKGKEKGKFKGKSKTENGKGYGGDDKPDPGWEGSAAVFRSPQMLMAWNGETAHGPGPGRRILKTHRPPSSTVWIGGTDVFGSDKAKMIVVTCTPMDALTRMYTKESEWKELELNDEWVKSWTAGKEGLLNMDWWTWHEEWWAAAADNPGTIPLCLEDLKSRPLPTLRQLVDRLGWKVSDDVLQSSIEASFAETREKIGLFKELLTAAQTKIVLDVHASRKVAQCPFKSDVWA